MTMLDTSAMDRVLNNWLADNGFECEVKCDTDFAYYYADSLITYALVVSERMDNLFLDFANRHGLKVDCGIFLLSFFHELGHNETMDELEDDEFYNGDKNKLEPEEYFNLTEEIVATEWAIDYINNHADEVERLAKDFQEEMKKFLEKNEIEG